MYAAAKGLTADALEAGVDSGRVAAGVTRAPARLAPAGASGGRPPPCALPHFDPHRVQARSPHSAAGEPRDIFGASGPDL